MSTERETGDRYCVDCKYHSVVAVHPMDRCRHPLSKCRSLITGEWTKTIEKDEEWKGAIGGAK